ALKIDPRALGQKEKLVRELVGIAKSRGAASLREILPLMRLVRLDDRARRMVLLGNFDSGVCNRASSGSRTSELVGDEVDPGFHLRPLVARIVTCQFRPDRVSFGCKGADIFGDKQVL